ncbi:hypothetical protein LVJ82_17305 [Vitreoscilla massiliensis]|uniref:Uncharacterized protein n=1 Tax=Vitreoscilla massiliensis TaxID=1689272 RepID=A0ABY4E4H0_9NEIS|nr:hypothetical protein [Vitreoscilla massiliensis]UOO89178.1 hypothetical protein LVJ82_17305 [Vitreoscilla massiliensis]
MVTINTNFVMGQIEHWLGTLTNGYLGSNYGIDLYEKLQKPMSEFDGDSIIRKMRQDIPLLQAISSDSLNIYFQRASFDCVKFYVQVNGMAREFEIKV